MTLFANSVKFTDKGSITVSFSARKTEEGVNLHIEVKDTGMGIAPNAAKKFLRCMPKQTVTNHPFIWAWV